MRICLEPCTSDDFRDLLGRAAPARVRGIAARLEGRTVGVGGFVFHDDGTVWASMLATPEVRRYPTAVYRAAVLAMRIARRTGLRKVFAVADWEYPAAGRFLERLGFEVCGELNGESIYVWHRDSAMP